MKRNGLLIAGGVVGIIRGCLGIFGGLASLSMLDVYDEFVPGLGTLVIVEFLLAIVILIVAIWVLSKSNDPASAPTIEGWGVAIIAAGVVDLIWGMSLLGSGPDTLAAAMGSLVALGLIGGLLIAGARGLESQTDVASDVPS